MTILTDVGDDDDDDEGHVAISAGRPNLDESPWSLLLLVVTSSRFNKCLCHNYFPAAKRRKREKLALGKHLLRKEPEQWEM